MQTMNTAAARNQFKAAAKPTKIGLPAAHKSTVTAPASATKPTGKKPGSSVAGFDGALKKAKV